MDSLFDEPKTEYRLFDAMRLRFVPTMMSRLSEREAAERNASFEKSRCGHLRWQTAEEKSVRIYTIKR